VTDAPASTAPFSLADFLARARARLLGDAPSPGGPASFGDHTVDPSIVEFFAGQAPRSAAVLIPVVDRDEPTILLTRRTEILRAHKGQIAFPGGRMDADDPSPLATALREAEEEIGLAPRHVDLLGYLDLYRTVSGYCIVPVVGLVTPPFALTVNPAEVDHVFEVPLAFLMNPANHRRETREWQGRQRRYMAMPYEEHYIWGVTAGILANLHARLYGP
jgi:8-oxo-dGTP pyrophosphatase MutT (NUDIX family)